jgi:hypothetical protein
MEDKIVRWRGLDPGSTEHCQIVSTAVETLVRSTIITTSYGLFYSIALDEHSLVKTVRLERTDGAALDLLADGAGNWTDASAGPLTALKDCLDVDIWPTPLTNSLPLWRSEWTTGTPQSFAMAWIDADAMTVRRSEQIYTLLDDTHVRFQSDDFERVIEIDADRLVVDYPGLFERIA